MLLVNTGLTSCAIDPDSHSKALTQCQVFELWPGARSTELVEDVVVPFILGL